MPPPFPKTKKNRQSAGPEKTPEIPSPGGGGLGWGRPNVATYSHAPAFPLLIRAFLILTLPTGRRLLRALLILPHQSALESADTLPHRRPDFRKPPRPEYKQYHRQNYQNLGNPQRPDSHLKAPTRSYSPGLPRQPHTNTTPAVKQSPIAPEIPSPSGGGLRRGRPQPRIKSPPDNSPQPPP